jgi:hypothetical protein
MFSGPVDRHNPMLKAMFWDSIMGQVKRIPGEQVFLEDKKYFCPRWD